VDTSQTEHRRGLRVDFFLVAPNYTFKQRLILAVVPPLAYMIICLLGVTLRYEDVSEEGAEPAYHTPPPLIYALWHRCLLACAWRFRNGDIHILISQSFDGELIARTVRRLGFVPVRGSSSRDGAVGLRNLQREEFEAKVRKAAEGPWWRTDPAQSQPG